MCITTNFLEKNERDELQQTFMALDKNADGKLSRQELIDGYTQMYGNAKEREKDVDYIIKNVDINRSGYIDYSGRVFLITNRVLISFNKQKEDFIREEFKESVSAI